MSTSSWLEKFKYLRLKELPTHDGEKCSDPSVRSFDDWIRILEDTAEDLGESYLNLFKQKIRGHLKRDFKTLPPMTWHNVKAKLIKDFSDLPTSWHASWRMQMEPQAPDEKLYAYISRYAGYLDRSEGLKPVDCKDRQAMFSFIVNLHNKTIRTKLSHRNFKNLAEVFEQARDVERRLKNSDAFSGYLMNSQPITINAVNTDQHERINVNALTPQQLQYVKCYECGDRGHLARDCANKKPKVWYPRPQGAIQFMNDDQDDGAGDDDANEKSNLLPATTDPVLTQILTSSTKITKKDFNTLIEALSQNPRLAKQVSKNLGPTGKQNQPQRNYGRKPKNTPQMNQQVNKNATTPKVVPDIDLETDNQIVAHLASFIRENCEGQDLDQVKTALEPIKQTPEAKLTSVTDVLDTEEDLLSDDEEYSQE